LDKEYGIKSSAVRNNLVNACEVGGNTLKNYLEQLGTPKIYNSLLVYSFKGSPFALKHGDELTLWWEAFYGD
jgi:hypothetical protein